MTQIATQLAVGVNPIADRNLPGALESIGTNTAALFGALLGVSSPPPPPPGPFPTPLGGLFLVGGLNVAALTVGMIAPGVRSWLVEPVPGFTPVPHLLAQGFVAQNAPLLVGGAQIRLRGVGPFPPGHVEIWLVDATETPIDPALVLGTGQGPQGPNFVSFLATGGGNAFIFIDPPPPP